MSESAFPTADDIARAVVTAARLMDENPLAIVRGAAGLRGRPIAFEALKLAFPQARRGGLATAVGFKDVNNASAKVSVSRKCTWWREEQIDEVLGAIVAESYGEQAA